MKLGPAARQSRLGQFAAGSVSLPSRVPAGWVAGSSLRLRGAGAVKRWRRAFFGEEFAGPFPEVFSSLD